MDLVNTNATNNPTSFRRGGVMLGQGEQLAVRTVKGLTKPIVPIKPIDVPEAFQARQPENRGLPAMRPGGSPVTQPFPAVNTKAARMLRFWLGKRAEDAGTNLAPPKPLPIKPPASVAPAATPAKVSPAVPAVSPTGTSTQVPPASVGSPPVGTPPAAKPSRIPAVEARRVQAGSSGGAGDQGPQGAPGKVSPPDPWTGPTVESGRPGYEADQGLSSPRISQPDNSGQVRHPGGVLGTVNSVMGMLGMDPDGYSDAEKWMMLTGVGTAAGGGMFGSKGMSGMGILAAILPAFLKHFAPGLRKTLGDYGQLASLKAQGAVFDPARASEALSAAKRKRLTNVQGALGLAARGVRAVGLPIRSPSLSDSDADAALAETMRSLKLTDKLKGNQVFGTKVREALGTNPEARDLAKAFERWDVRP